MLNNYIILTGASGNIGNKLAYFLLNKGYALIITSRNIEHLEEMQNIFQEYKNSIVFKELDLADQKSIESFVDSLRGLRIKGLVNNAATDNVDTIERLSYENLQNIININYVGTVYLSKMLVQQSVDKGQSLNIVNISSLLSIFGAKKSAAYSASKAALEAFTRNLTVEYADKGIVCNSIRIAGVAGDLNIYGSKTKVIRYDEKLTIKNKKNDIKQIPTGRFLTFAEINSMVEFLLSDKAMCLNGQSINIDGGTSIKYPGYNI